MKWLILYGGSLILTLFTLWGDCLIKEATITPSDRKAVIFLILTSIMWAAQPYGWYFIVKNYSLFQAGVLFTAIALIGGTLIASLYYKEPVSVKEWIGMFLVFCGMFLVGRNE